MTGILAADAAGPEKVTKLVLVDVVPRYEKDGSARIRDFMFSHVDGFESLEEAADAVAAYLPHRTKPRSPEGLKKNLRLRDGRWYWHWDPAFLTKPARRSVRPGGEARAGGDRPGDPDPADPRQAVRRGQRRGGARTSSRRCPRAEFVELSEAGHTAAGDDNDAFSEVVVQFVNRVTASGFNFLEQPELPAPQVSEAQAEQILCDPLRPDRAGGIAGQPTGQELPGASMPTDRPLGVLKIANPAFTRGRTGSAGPAARTDRRRRSRRCGSRCRCPTSPARSARP